MSDNVVEYYSLPGNGTIDIVPFHLSTQFIALYITIMKRYGNMIEVIATLLLLGVLVALICMS